MFRLIFFCGMTLMTTVDGHQCQNPIEDMDTNTNKKEKRRAQNVEAAKRSYEAKKKERSALQSKNTELYETQMQLIHDKCRLEAKTSALEQILEAMVHSCSQALSRSTFHSSDARHECKGVTSTTPCLLGEYRISVKEEPCQDENMALDLSARSQHRDSPFTDAPLVMDIKDDDACSYSNDDDHSTPGKDEDPDDRHIMDASTLGLGATQEVEQVNTTKRRGRQSRDSNNNEGGAFERGVFLPEIKPKKSRRDDHVTVSRPARACATDALKRQRKPGLSSRDNRASSC